MSPSTEVHIIQLHLRHFTQDQITAALRTGSHESQDACAISDKPGSFRKLHGSDDQGNVHTPWTEAEDHQLLHDWLTVGPRWKQLSAKWGTQSASQLKNRWYHVLRHRVQDRLSHTNGLARFLPQGRTGLLVPVLA
jgi:hypothetical protein